MTAYVRVRKVDLLVERVDATGTQVDVAAAAGLSVQRVNQLVTGAHSVVEVRKARRLETALGVPHGTLFEAVDSGLLAPYIQLADPVDPDPVDPGPGDTTGPGTHAAPTASAA